MLNYNGHKNFKFYYPSDISYLSSKSSSASQRSELLDNSVINPFRTKKTLAVITGATGHLGSVFLKLLENEACDIRALIIENEVPRFLQDSKAKFYKGDVRDKESLRNLLEDIEDYQQVYFFHLASKVSILEKDATVFAINVDGTRNVIDLCKSYKVKRLIYVSSVHALPEGDGRAQIEEFSVSEQFNPQEVVGDYAKSKSIASKLVMEANDAELETVILHPSGIIGPGDYLMGYTSSLLLAFLRKHIKQVVKGGYDFIDVRDVANCVKSAAYLGKGGECYILSNQYYEIKDILNIMAEFSGLKKIRRYVPFGLAKFFCPLLLFMNKLSKSKPLYTKYSLYTLRANSSFNHNKASEVLALSTRPITETIRDTMGFLLEVSDNKLKRIVQNRLAKLNKKKRKKK